MIPSGVQIYVALEPVDMRYSFDRLSGIAKELPSGMPPSKAVFAAHLGQRGEVLLWVRVALAKVMLVAWRRPQPRLAVPSSGVFHVEPPSDCLVRGRERASLHRDQRYRFVGISSVERAKPCLVR